VSADNLEEMLLRWEELTEEGQTVAPEDLCRDYPELLPELRRRIAALQALEPVLGTASELVTFDALAAPRQHPQARRIRRSHYSFPVTRYLVNWGAAAWASSTRPGSRASAASSPLR
jgi:hypothetical protein